MKPNMILIIAFIFSSSLNAQDSLQKRHIIFEAYVKDTHSGIHKGYLATMNDSLLFISERKLIFSFMNARENGSLKFDYTNLDQVRLQRKASFGRGVLFGALGGLAVGEIYVLISGNQQSIYNLTPRQKAVIYGITGTIAGFFIGAILGGVAHKTFVIKGKKEKFQEMKSEMIKRVY